MARHFEITSTTPPQKFKVKPRDVGTSATSTFVLKPQLECPIRALMCDSSMPEVWCGLKIRTYAQLKNLTPQERGQVIAQNPQLMHLLFTRSTDNLPVCPILNNHANGASAALRSLSDKSPRFALKCEQAMVGDGSQQRAWQTYETMRLVSGGTGLRHCEHMIAKQPSSVTDLEVIQ